MSRVRAIKGSAILAEESDKAADTPARGGVTAPAVVSGIRGLGDMVALIANPIARAIGLDKSKCGCQKRQAWLNEKFPLK